MSTIHQIYCTHCTHGSSALERREGELARRMLGYSARAGSLEARHLRRYYRQIERYVSYYLPRDTPSEEKLRLGAASAPRRLVYHPSTGGLQVVGQVCYRQTDTEGRPGSYFAHVLFHEEKDGQPRWSPLDCLKLWGAAGWVDEDSPNIPFLLEPLDSLDQVLEGERPAIDDRVFLSFLSTPAGGSFDDPAGAIPKRWRQLDAARRSSLFVDAFRGFLEITGERRGSLLLVIEPSVAALVFYGILRLLPAGEIRDRVSFSTFEPNADRVGTSLAATLFHDPQQTDLRADAYRSRGFVINTFSNRQSESRHPQAQYARTMVRRLLEDGWPAVDGCLAGFASAGARRPLCQEDLDALSRVDNLVPALFDPAKPPPADDWRRSPITANYFRRALARHLDQLSDLPASLEPIVGRPSHLLILEILGDVGHDSIVPRHVENVPHKAGKEEIPGTHDAAAFLLARLPGEQIADLVKLDGISAEVKVDVLVRHVTAHAELPPGCEHLWCETGRGARHGHLARVAPRNTGETPVPPNPLLTQVMVRLDENALEKFYAQVADQHSDAFLMILLAAWKQEESLLGAGLPTPPQPWLGQETGHSAEESARAGLARIVRAMDTRALVSLFLAHGPAFFQEYPEDEPALGAKLHEIVGSLTGNVGQFSERLDVALAGRHLLLDEDLNMVTGWANVRGALLDISRLQQERSGILRKRPLRSLETACRRMAQGAFKAMPRKRFDDDREGNRKQEHLRQLGRRLSGGRPLLPLGIWQYDALWQKVAWYFQNGTWPTAPLAKMCRRPWSFRPSRRLVGVVAAVVLVVAAILVFRSSGGDKPGDGGGWQGHPAPVAPHNTGETPVPPGRVAAQTPPKSDASARRAHERREQTGAARRATEREHLVRPSWDHQPAREVAPEEPAAERPAEPPATEQADDPWKAKETATREAEAEALPPPAERPAPSAPQPIREPPTESARSQEEIWNAQAEQFARAHGGKFFDEEPLVEGELRISADALPVSTGSGALFLGSGALHFDHAIYPFGVGFDAEPPVSRHEVPELAAALGFPSVYVELQARESGSAVVLGLVPNPNPPDAEDRKKELLEQVERNARQIIVQLRIHQSRTATQEAKDAAFENLVKLTGMEIPSVPPKPNRRDEDFREHPEAYRAALKAYNEAVTVHNRAVDSVVPTAKQAVASVDAKKEYIENEIRQYEEQLRKHNQAGLATLREQCRRISVILYRAVAGEAASGRSAVERGSVADAVASVEVRFHVEERPAPGLNPPVIARIRPIVSGAGGRALPSWFREELVTGCRIVEQNEEGFLLRNVELRDIDVERVADVFEKTTALRVRFLFSPRSDQTFGQEQEKVTAAASHVIDSIEQGKQYTIKAELTDEGLDWLRLLGKNNRPAVSNDTPSP